MSFAQRLSVWINYWIREENQWRAGSSVARFLFRKVSGEAKLGHSRINLRPSKPAKTLATPSSVTDDVTLVAAS